MSKNENLNSRRSFLTFLKQASEKASDHSKNEGKDKVKMLTPDGNLVEIDRSVIDKSKFRKKAGKEDILNWIQSVPNSNQKHSS